MIAGIDDIAVYIPRLYFDANDYAKLRGVDATKLQKGLGVYKMAIVDSNQDPWVKKFVYKDDLEYLDKRDQITPN